jgi:peptidoglycan/LPS O-acetylase OafA/YrhL
METTVDAAAPAAAVAPGPAAVRLGHRPALDGLRGVAVLLVVLVHSGNSLWPSASGWLAQGGPLGVHLFFVLSGFLITTLLLGEHGRTGRIRLGRFAFRRTRRLVPAVVAVLLALGVVAATGDRLRVGEVVSSAVYIFTATVNSLLLGFTFPRIDEVTGGGIVTELLHMWSLSIEVQFYALWAVALFLMTRLRLSLRTMAAVTTAVVVGLAVARYRALAGGATWLDLYFTTWSRLDAPLVGSLAGIAFVAGWWAGIARRLVVALGVTGLAAFLATAFLTDWSLRALPEGLYTVLAGAAALTILAVITVGDGGLARALSWRPLVWLGTVSYSLYVWHYGLFFTIERRDPDWPGPVRFVVGVSAALVVASASYYLVERPFLGRSQGAHVHRYRQLLARARPVHDPADGRDVGVVAPPAHGHVAVGLDEAVGGVEVDPAGAVAGHVEAHPGVRGIGAD